MIISTSTILQYSYQLNEINASLQGIVSVLRNQPFYNTQLFAVIVTGCLSLIPWLYLLYKDRPIIKVTVSNVFVPTSLGNNLLNGLSITARNYGRRPITLSNVYLRFKDGESLVFMSNSNFVGGTSGLPKILEGGNSHMVAIIAGELGESFLKKQCYPIYACYGDALGHVYKAKTSEKFWNIMFKVE